MSGSVLAANQARREAEEGLTKTEEAKRKAEAASKVMQGQVKELEAKLKKAEAAAKVTFQLVTLAKNQLPCGLPVEALPAIETLYT